MSNNPGPTVRRRQLAAALRRHRTDAGLSVKEVAEHLMCSQAKISRIETAQRNATLRDVRDLSDIFRLSDEERSWLMTLARESREHAWWQAFDHDPGLETMIGLEGAARAIREFQPLTIPGLLQTREYAAAITEIWRTSAQKPSDRQDAVDLRMKRQQILTENGPPEFSYVLDEAAIHRLVGNASVMRAQLEHLISLVSGAVVTLQIVPYGAGAHKGMSNGFMILDFAKPEGKVPAIESGLPTVVYIESLIGEMYLDQPADVTPYLDAFVSLQHKALTSKESVQLLQSLSRSL